MRLSWGRCAESLARDVLLVAWLVAWLELARLVLVASLWGFTGAQAGAGDIAAILTVGFRFDVRLAVLLAGPSLLLSLLAIGWELEPLRRRLRLVLGRAFVLLTALAVMIDVGYFQEYRDQFNHFIFGAIYDDQSAILATIWRSYPVLRMLLAALAAAALGWWLAPRLLARSLISRFQAEGWPIWLRVVASLILAGLVVAGARGSFGKLPASLKTAAVTGDDTLNKLVPNPWWCLKEAIAVHRELSGTTGVTSFLPDGDVGAAIRRWKGADAADIDLATARQAAGTRTPARHVVLIVGESYSAWPLRQAWRPLHLADGVAGLAERGILLDRFISGGSGTMSSLGVIVSGLTDTGIDIAYHPGARRLLPTAPAGWFRNLGYRTRFFYGGYLSWQRIGDLVRAQGFDEVYGAGDLGAGVTGGEWGVDDERIYEFALAHADDASPTYSVILTVSNHPPFALDLQAKGVARPIVPPELAAQVDPATDLNVLGHFRYADRSLAAYVERAQQKLPRSLFAITGDHYGRRFPNAHPDAYERLAVPLVLYGPEVLTGSSLPPGAAGGHIDMGATLFERCAPAGTVYHSFGSDLLAMPACPAGFGRDAVITASEAWELGSTPNAPEMRRYRDLQGLAWWRLVHGADPTWHAGR